MQCSVKSVCSKYYIPRRPARVEAVVAELAKKTLQTCGASLGSPRGLGLRRVAPSEEAKSLPKLMFGYQYGFVKVRQRRESRTIFTRNGRIDKKKRKKGRTLFVCATKV